MWHVRGHAIQFDDLVVFPMLEVRQPLNDDVDGAPAVLTVEVLKTPRRLSADKIRQVLLVIQSVLGCICQNLLLLY